MANETLSLLQQATAEIKRLQTQNNLMAAKLEVFDKMIMLLQTAPNYPSVGMGESLAWKIDKHISAYSDNQDMT